MIPLALAAGALLGYGLSTIAETGGNSSGRNGTIVGQGWFVPPHRKDLSEEDMRAQLVLMKEGFSDLARGNRPSEEFLDVVAYEVDADDGMFFADTDEGDRIYDTCVDALMKYHSSTTDNEVAGLFAKKVIDFDQAIVEREKKKNGGGGNNRRRRVNVSERKLLTRRKSSTAS